MEAAFHALLLGIVEGLTEFIPVSSTGHLILLIDLLGAATPPGQVFEIVIQLGAIFAVCWYYRKKLFGAVRAALKELSPHPIPFPEGEGSVCDAHTSEPSPRGEEREDREAVKQVRGIHPKDTPNLYFLFTILLAFMPAAVLGVLLHGFIKSVLFNPLVVANMLVMGGVLIILIERFKPEPIHRDSESFDWKLALKIGFCQALAMIPGTSRSGATIMGALLLKVERRAATEFSFFLAIPTMLGATVVDLYKNWSLLTMDAFELIAIGFVAAFLSALLVVRSVIAFISRHGFVPFAYYRIAVGSVMLVLLLA